jgi:hypothetical protein
MPWLPPRPPLPPAHSRCATQLATQPSPTPPLAPAPAGTDAQREIAVLAVEGGAPPGAAPLPVGASAGLRVGQTVYALGARYGEGKSMSAGGRKGGRARVPAGAVGLDACGGARRRAPASFDRRGVGLREKRA